MIRLSCLSWREAILLIIVILFPLFALVGDPVYRCCVFVFYCLFLGGFFGIIYIEIYFGKDVKKRSQRTPKDYDGTQITTRRVNELLPLVLSQVGETYKDRPDLILATWPDVIGAKLAPMTQAISFADGVLIVKVKNSTLHSLLSQHEKSRLIACYRKKFPQINLKTIFFRIG